MRENGGWDVAPEEKERPEPVAVLSPATARDGGIAAIRQKGEGRGRAGDKAVSTMSLQNKKESVEEENAVHETLRSSDSYLESEIIDELSSEGSCWSSKNSQMVHGIVRIEHSVTRNRNRNFFG